MNGDVDIHMHAKEMWCYTNSKNQQHESKGSLDRVPY